MARNDPLRNMRFRVDINQITQAYFDGIQRILTGEQDVQASMDQANEEIQALLQLGVPAGGKPSSHFLEHGGCP